MNETKTNPTNTLDCIELVSGRYVSPLRMKAEDVEITDIAHALSQKCRFTGHCLAFYSVAQHSVAVARLVPEKDRKWGLLHDAGEAYLSDVARPIKQWLKGFNDIEAGVMRAVCEKYGLDAEMPESVKWADNMVLRAEAKLLMPSKGEGWCDIPGLADHEINIALGGCLSSSPAHAYGAFIEMAHELGLAELPF